MQSKKFNLTITTAVAGSILAGCQPDYQDETIYASHDTAVCMDKQTNQRVRDEDCHRDGSHTSWFFVNRGSAVPYYGEYASGGSYVPRKGAAYKTVGAAAAMTRGAAISRGGFGSTGHAFSSAGG